MQTPKNFHLILLLTVSCCFLCGCNDQPPELPRVDKAKPKTAAHDDPQRDAAPQAPAAPVSITDEAAALLKPIGDYLEQPTHDPGKFVGRAACIDCHKDEHAAFVGSHHDLAMDLATEETVLADFNDTTFTHQKITSRFFRDGEKFMVHTEGADGKMTDFEVKYVFGVDPLQQYLVEFPDGRVQCLTIAWDVHKKRWYTLYPDEYIPHDDELHWTKPSQNWNYMCAECHSTNLQKNFDLSTNTYNTTFSEIDVSCEACHGPGEAHVAWAKAEDKSAWDLDYTGLAVKLKGAENARVQVETCARCHSRRRIVHPDYRQGKPFTDSYAVQLLEERLYFPDGQIRDEVYVYGSFIQSKMYHKGVRCTDCHEPHSAKLIVVGNALCNRCHKPDQYDTPKHHHHQVGSAGSHCVDCHMPERTYMVVDPRRDHGFKIPRPDLSVALGTPNACNGCHQDEGKGETAQWAADKIVEWYGVISPHRPSGVIPPAMVFDRAFKGDPLAAGPLSDLAGDASQSAMVRASALSLLRRYTGPQAAGAAGAAFAGLEDDEPLVRAAALGVMEALPAEQTLRWLTPLLSDRSRLVRTEAARVASRAGVEPLRQAGPDVAQAFRGALTEYLKGQEAVVDRPGAHLNVAVIHENLGQPAKAKAAYETAIALDEQFVPARMNLAVLLDGMGDKAGAEQQLRAAVRIRPQLAEAHYSLGLLLAEKPETLAEAASHLTSAAQLRPGHPRMQYNAGLAHQQLGRVQDAKHYLDRALTIQPDSATFLNALIILHMQRQEFREALPYAQRLAQLRPGDPRYQEPLHRIMRMLGGR